LDLVQGVPARCAYEPADSFPGCAPVNLRGTAHMKGGVARGIFDALAVDLAIDSSSPNAQLGVSGEVSEGVLEVVLLKGQVAVELDEEVPRIRPGKIVAIIEGFDDAAACFAKAAVLTMHGLDPCVLLRSRVDEEGSLVG